MVFQQIGRAEILTPRIQRFEYEIGVVFIRQLDRNEVHLEEAVSDVLQVSYLFVLIRLTFELQSKRGFQKTLRSLQIRLLHTLRLQLRIRSPRLYSILKIVVSRIMLKNVATLIVQISSFNKIVNRCSWPLFPSGI